MADRCRIRAASSADLAAVAAIERASFEDPWSLESFRHHLGDVFLVAERGGQVVGYLVAWRLGPEAEILNVAVATPARREGVARDLLDDALAQLAGAGVARVFLEVRVSNAAARRLYATAGFEEVGRRPGYYHRPREDALVLARTVDRPAGPASDHADARGFG